MHTMHDVCENACGDLSTPAIATEPPAKVEINRLSSLFVLHCLIPSNSYKPAELPR